MASADGNYGGRMRKDIREKEREREREEQRDKQAMALQDVYGCFRYASLSCNVSEQGKLVHIVLSPLSSPYIKLLGWCSSIICYGISLVTKLILLEVSISA